MSRLNDVHSGIWGKDEWLDLSPNAKLLYLWSFTNPRCGMSGIYDVPRRVVAVETGMSLADVDGALRELVEARYVVCEGSVLFVRTRVKHLRQKTVQIAKSIAGDLRRLGPEHPVHKAFLDEYSDFVDYPDLVAQIRPDGSAPMEPLQEPQRPSPDPHLTVVEAHPSLKGNGKGGVNEEKDHNAGRAQAVRFGGKPVAAATLAVAGQLLAAFNAKGGTSYRPLDDQGRPTGDLKRILGALTGDKRITAEVGQRMIDLAFAEPEPYWAPSRPHPGNVFGPNVVGKYLDAALAASNGSATGNGSMSDDEWRKLVLK